MKKGINFSLLGTSAMILGVIIKIIDDTVMRRDMEKMVEDEVTKQLNQE